LFNCPGWSMSGGPWIKPDQTMRYLVSSEIRVTGPMKFQQTLPQPKEQFQDVALLAFPASQNPSDSLATHSPRVSCNPPLAGAERLVDGDLKAPVTIPVAAKGAFAVELETPQPFTARSLAIYPGGEAFGADCVLESADATDRLQVIRRFKFDRSNMNPGLGPMLHGPVTISFPPTTAKRFRVNFSGVYFGRLRGSTLSTQAALTEIELSGSPRVEAFVEKQLGKLHPTPTPQWDAYLWAPPLALDSPALAIAPEKEIDLSSRLAPDGTLHWDVPPGDWVILRSGMSPTGVSNAPAAAEGTGFEMDKMNRSAARAHFSAFIGEVLRRMPPAERKALKHVAADSYEVGSENWTDGFAATFRHRYGYSPLPWLPVLTGRIVGSADQSERFLWDLRRLVADRISRDYVGGLRDLSHEKGMKLWLENYGHWGFVGEFLQYGGQSDCVAGEFWTVKGLGSIEVRAASSVANIYGKSIAAAEAFTSGPKFQVAPWGLKALGDWAFCEGINHFVLSMYIHQAWDDRKPGVNAPWPTEFNRNNTWFNAAGAWVDYVRRCSFLLQQGHRVADVAYFIGEDAPKMTGIRQPHLPPGRDYDFINAEVILEKLSVKNGLLKLPQGTTYRVLALPQGAGMRPATLRKIRDLVKAGATVLGLPVVRSPSLENYPQCDEEMRKLAAQVWGSADQTPSSERSFGKGRVVWGKTLTEVLAGTGTGPDFLSETHLRFTHRVAGDRDVFFLANPSSEAVSTTTAFRISDKSPELWWPDSGRIEHPALYDAVDGTVRLPIRLGPNGAVFVVFTARVKTAGDRVVSITRNGASLLNTQFTPPPESEVPGASRAATNNFSFAIWVKPAVDTTLVVETNRGICAEPRNDVITPPCGSSFGGLTHAGCGLAVGRNGVVVFEDAEGCFAPVLVHGVPLTDWTHVAVVYREGQPSLFLNGAFAHRGLRSGFLVHPGVGEGPGVMPFRGEFGNYRQFDRVMTDLEISELAKSMPRVDTSVPEPSIEVTPARASGFEATVWQPGEYSLQTATGKSHCFSVGVVPPPAEIAGPWEVRFSPEWGGPERITFEGLVDWTTHPDEGVRYYSGAATYRKTVTLPKCDDHQRLWLDLGKVRDLATVRLNGKSLGTLWISPWRLDITAAARAGENVLEVEVVNPWNNRLVRDANLAPEKRLTFLLSPVVDKSAPLMPAGLLGPVTVRLAQRVTVK
jgi:hypothetical protein